LLALAPPVLGQKTEFVLEVPVSYDAGAPFAFEHTGGQFSGSLSVTGPFDLDGDGRVEVLLTDYSGGQRVHVLENQGVDAWEIVYSTPAYELESFSTAGGRYATGGDLDGDGLQEIIFVSGHNWAESEDNPVTSAGGGIFIYEHTGADNDFGDAAAAAFGPDAIGTPEPPYIKADNFTVADVDGDGTQELLWPNDASFPWDEWYILSVSGDIGSGFEVLVPELRLSSRNNEEVNYDPVLRGGGSTYAVNPADLDGDGTSEISFHAWNSLNFHNGDVTGTDTYVVPEEGDPNLYLQASGNDDLSWFNGVVVDINQDGDDEIFYPREYGYEDDANGNLYEYISVMNYAAGEDVLQITPDQFHLDLFGPLTAYGIAAGDLNDDGTMELIGAGRGFSGRDLTEGRSPQYLRIAEWLGGVGGDPEDPANYRITAVDFAVTPNDTLFNVVYRDSLGTETMYYENAGDLGAFPPGEAEEISPNRIAYLGDADGDGFKEVAASFFGINDTLQVIDEVWNVDSTRYDRTVREQVPAPHRPVLRVFEVNEAFVSADAPENVPTSFELHANYPNPFNPNTTFAYTLTNRATVSVKVYDVTGRLIRTLVDQETRAAGTYHARWDGLTQAGRRAANGTYFYTLESGEQRLARPMVLLK
jgi:hypothetical protein